VSTVDKIKDVIEQIRPFVLSHGGDFEFVDYVDGVVSVRMLGSCANCPMRKLTFNNEIKSRLMEEVQEVKDVVLV